MKKKTFKLFTLFFLLICTMILSSCGSKDSSASYEENDFEEGDNGEDSGSDYEEGDYTEDYPDSGSDYEEDSDDHSDSEESDPVKALFKEAFSAFQNKAMEDSVRIAEVNPEITPVSLPNPTEEDPYATATEDVEVYSIEMDGHRMQFTVDIKGEPDANGLYPLYIALHGGGESDPEENNSQWLQMRDYYSDSVNNGIYVATRGMEDVWNLHFLDYSYAMYDRLIEDLVLLGNADPNRVYLLGFSAGGDGVYAIAPRMADKFAAVNMSSGHPNGVSLLNTSNLPFQIQVGIRDFYSEDAMRSLRGAEFEDTLNGYNDAFHFGYPHSVLVHIPYGHNYNDYSYDPDESCVLTDPSEFARRCIDENWLGKFMDLYTSLGNEYSVSDLSYAGDDNFNDQLMDMITNDLGMDYTYETNTCAVDYVSSYTRDPAPDKLVWDLSTRAPGRKDCAFYWLRADQSVNEGLISVYYEKESNSVTVWTDGNVNGDFSILATPYLMDFNRPLTIITEDGEFTKELNADKDVIEASIEETGDMYLGWAQEIPMSELK